MTVTHELKTWPQYFDAVVRGEKTFEVRRDDMGFQKGDTVILLRENPDNPTEVEYDYAGNPMYTAQYKIGWILTGGQLGIEPGYVVFSLEPSDD